jgi:hypothetical protein
VSLLQRLASVGLGRRDEEEARLPGPHPPPNGRSTHAQSASDAAVAART